MSIVEDNVSEARELVLEAEHVTVRFGGLTALADVGLSVPARSIIGLVGPNGAGKSTLFGVLSGILRPSEGRVSLGGVDVSKARSYERARMGMARTFQRPELFDGLTVWEHLVLAYRVRRARNRLWSDLLDGRAWRRPDKEEDGEVGEIIAALGLEDIAHRQTIGLSLGLSRLVEVARALAADPSVILLDEPCSGLDRHEVSRLVHVLRGVPDAFGSAVLMIEHDVETILGLSEHVYVLDFGRIIASGVPAAIRSSAAVKAAYLGDEGEEPNVAAKELEHEGEDVAG